MAKQNPFSTFLTKQEFCELVPGGITQRTADRWHEMRMGPPRVRIGGKVLYPLDGIEKWLAGQRAQAEKLPRRGQQ